MIKILSGFTGPGGSTIAFNTLVNLFNSRGLTSCLYGPSKWAGITCKFSFLNELNLSKEDILIYHYLPITDRLPCKKQILSCHETVVFEINKIPGLMFDVVHFVSESQKKFQNIDGVVIPNPIRKFIKTEKNFKVAGIIGSIDPNKRVHHSILAAKKDGFKDIRLYGNLTDHGYFVNNVLPLLSDEVTYRGVASDMNSVYSQLSHVYHSPILETFNLVKPECISAGVTYVGNEGNDTLAEYWDDDKVFESWKKLLLS